MRATVFIIMALALPAQADEGQDGFSALVDLLKDSDDAAFQLDMLKGMREGLRGRQNVRMPRGWTAVSARLAKSPNEEVRALARMISTLFGDPHALSALRATVADAGSDAAARHAALDTLLGARDAGLAPVLILLLKDQAMQGPALRGLSSCGDDGTPAAIFAIYASLPVPEKRDAINTLSSRLSFALQLIRALREKSIPKGDLTAFTVRQLRSYGNAGIDKWIDEEWGKVRTTPEAKEQEIARYKALVAADGPTPDPSRGRAFFSRTCMQCHTLFDAGGKVGPELTGSNRADLDYLLSNILDPSAVMAKEYNSTLIRTKDDRLISGIISKDETESVTVITENDTLVIAKSQIDAVKVSEISMMPEGLLAGLSDGEVRDLVAYLRGPTQAPLPVQDEIFNGKDLTGWDGSAEVWTVENGELVGKGALKKNNFLFSKMPVADFRLIVEVKMLDDTCNSGIQFRSEPVKGGEARGYQADVGAGWWGKLYHESGRGLLWNKPADQHVKKGDWNTYEILAVGNKIRTALNGNLCVDLEDAKADPVKDMKGLIAVQVHSGKMTDVRFRNFKLEHNPKFELKTVK